MCSSFLNEETNGQGNLVGDRLLLQAKDGKTHLKARSEQVF